MNGIIESSTNLGAGPIGEGLSRNKARNGIETMNWCRTEEEADAVRGRGLLDNHHLTTDLKEAVQFSDHIDMAIKAGQELSLEEMDALMERYLKEEFNRTCPHGRPIIHELTKDDFKRWFKR